MPNIPCKKATFFFEPSSLVPVKQMDLAMVVVLVVVVLVVVLVTLLLLGHHSDREVLSLRDQAHHLLIFCFCICFLA